MTTPSIKGTATSTVDTVGGTSMSVTKPTGAATNDIYVLLCSAQGFNSGSGAQPTTPTGWTLLATATTSGAGSVRHNRGVAYARRYDGTEGSSFTIAGFDGGVTYGILSCFVVQDAEVGTIAAALDGTPASNTAGGGSASSIAMPAVTTTAANSMAFACVSTYGNPVGSTPTGWTQRQTLDGDYFHLNDKAMATAGSTGTATASLTTEHAAVALVFAFKEAAAAGTAVAPRATLVAARTAIASVQGTANIAPRATISSARTAVSGIAATTAVAPRATIVAARTAIADVTGTATASISPRATVVGAITAIASVVGHASVVPRATLVAARTAIANVGAGSLLAPISTYVSAFAAVPNVGATTNVVPFATIVTSRSAIAGVGDGTVGAFMSGQSIENLVRSKLSVAYVYSSRVSLVKLVRRWKIDNKTDYQKTEAGDRPYWTAF